MLAFGRHDRSINMGLGSGPGWCYLTVVVPIPLCRNNDAEIARRFSNEGMITVGMLFLVSGAFARADRWDPSSSEVVAGRKNNRFRGAVGGYASA